MKMSRFTRFVRVNLIGLLALMNVIAIFMKFRVERPQTITYKCAGRHAPLFTNQFQQVAGPAPVVRSLDLPERRPPVNHSLQGDWDGDLKEAACDYTMGVADGVPMLQTGDGRYFKRGDLTRWGRIKWIAPDFFTTDKMLVRLGGGPQVATLEGGTRDSR